MALTLWPTISKSGPKIAFGIINYDKCALVRLQQKDLLNFPFPTHLKCAQFSSQSGSRFRNKATESLCNAPNYGPNQFRLSSQLKPNIRQETDNISQSSQNEVRSTSSDNRPSPEHLNFVFDVLSKDLPRLFVKSFNYHIYHPEIVFENNIHGRRTVGLYQYVKQISFLRIFGHLKYAYVKFDILKITQHPEDSTIKVRWTINGISGWKVIVLFWKYRIWDFKKLFEKQVPWYDGFSTFYVNGHGRVYKHVADKMMPDMDREETSSTESHISAAKLALIVGISPKFLI